jgi:glutaredoxin|tara:strand:- start:307 stop:558 length:252 start_codon:yes stop_codon:yes gene_type:complete
MYEIYSIANCPFCEKAKELLRETGEGITEYAIDIQVSMGKRIMERSLMNTVPIIYRNDELIGGYNDLRMYLNKEERTHDAPML